MTKVEPAMRVLILLAAGCACLWMVISPMAQGQGPAGAAPPARTATVAVDAVPSDDARRGFLMVETNRGGSEADGPIAGNVTIRLKSDPPAASVEVGKFLNLPGVPGPQSYAFDLKAVPAIDARFLEKIASGEAVVDVKVSAMRPASSGGGDAGAGSKLSIVTSTFNK